MWKKLKDTDHFLQFYSKNQEVCVTDYVSIWWVQFSDESFKDCLKGSNFGLDISETALVLKGKHMLTNPEDLKNVCFKKDGKTLVLTLAMSFGFPVRLQMNLTEGSKELFYKKITQPLLNTVQNLYTSQRELRDLLKKKDLEIDEYKCEGGEIALRFLKTIPFNNEGHMLKYPVYNEYFGPSDVPNCLLNKSVVVPETDIVKAEPSVSNIKQEQPESNGQTQAESAETPSISSSKIKSETTEIKSEGSMLTKTEANIKEEIKMETLTQTQSPSRLQARPGVVGPSPSKRNRRKLNL